MDENFFLKYDNARLSKMYDNGEVITDYDVVEEIPYFSDQYTSEDLINMIKQVGNEYNVPMCEKLAVLFNYDITGIKKEETTPEEKIEETVINEDSIQEEWIDNRTFFEKYTPMNILREIKYRITGK